MNEINNQSIKKKQSDRMYFWLHLEVVESFRPRLHLYCIHFRSDRPKHSPVCHWSSNSPAPLSQSWCVGLVELLKQRKQMFWEKFWN